MDEEQGRTTSSGGKCCSCIQDADLQSATTILRITNLVNAGLIIFAGIYSMISLSDVVTLHVAAIAVSVYITCFGLLLCCFEVRLSSIEKVVRRRFGFMYTFLGRTLFLFFVASFCFARYETSTIAIGVVTLLNGIMNAFVMWKHGEVYSDPTGKYSTAEESASTYIQNNPELASAAIGAGVNYARENPQLARAGANAGAQYAREHPDAVAAVVRQQQQQQSVDNPFSVSRS